MKPNEGYAASSSPPQRQLGRFRKFAHEAGPNTSTSRIPAPYPPPPPMTVSDEAESSSLTRDGTIVPVKDDKFRSSLCAVQRILKYTFRNISLLEEALTHASFSGSPSYQRLEFVGDACLNLAFANFVFFAYPNLDPGQLSVIRAANISNEKFARAAVRHDLFSFVRQNEPSFLPKVKEFALAIEEEDETLPSVKAPKILADIVESVAAALYVDCNFDCKLLWEHFSPILEPIITVENIQDQPVTMLYELCQKEGTNLDFKHSTDGAKHICSFSLNGKQLSSASSEDKDISKRIAAKEALQKLSKSESKLTKENQHGSEISNYRFYFEGCDFFKWEVSNSSRMLHTNTNVEEMNRIEHLEQSLKFEREEKKNLEKRCKLWEQKCGKEKMKKNIAYFFIFIIVIFIVQA